MKKLFLRAEFGPLWEPWEVDEIGRKILSLYYGNTKLEVCLAKNHQASRKPLYFVSINIVESSKLGFKN